MPFILEGLVTTRDSEGKPHVAPMGPEVSLLPCQLLDDAHFTELIFKPYQTSSTLKHLLATKVGVFQVTDEVKFIAQGAIGEWPEPPAFMPASKIPGDVISSCCSWYEFEIIEADLSNERTRLVARVVHQQVQRSFLGYNRARHAVIEAAILATRINFIPKAELLAQFAQLKILIDKTAGEAERWSFVLLSNYVLEHARQT